MKERKRKGKGKREIKTKTEGGRKEGKFFRFIPGNIYKNLTQRGQ